MDLKQLPIKHDLLFQQVVKQHPEISRIHPHSINTFRVATFVNQHGAVEVKFVILRFAMNGDKVDNATSGGGWVFIDSEGRPKLSAYENKWTLLGDAHPDTGIKFSNLELPYYDEIISLCKNAHRRFPYTRLIGWDVYVDESGDPKLIEWNANNPSFWKMEAWYGPFFADQIP